jgi:putative oxidoreductase
MNAYDRVLPLIGRLLISIVFLLSGIMKLMSWSMVASMMVSKGFPIATVMLVGAVIVEILGGLCLLLGFKARIAAFILFLYLIPTTLAFHNFWAMQGPMRMDNQGHFLKNVAIMGGLLMVTAYGAGKLSIDGRATTRPA